jgi:hypothetical protein
MGIENAPLPPPVGPHLVVSMNASALHPVWPLHTGVQQRENRIDVASVEGLICFSK